jgi:class 3 adenylate cyclase/tetratricopeptide (TPR) repeat protein
VTLVFCDVTGSTALGERLDPESLRDVQSRYFDAMRAVIERHGGTVEKFIGDAVMAIFGIPQLHEDDALRAVRAAGEMREALDVLNKVLERDRGVTIQVRIGVNTGEVVVGDRSTGQALATGDAVNVAARLEQQAWPGDVVLGEATHRLVREAVEVEPVGPLELRGKAGAVPAWRLLGVRDVVTAVPRRLDSPMVGRERQLAQLRQAFQAAAGDRACQLFTVLGSAGVGKSRLVAEFLAGLGGDAEVLRGRCLPYGEGITYYPVVEAIKQAAGLADFDLLDVVEAKVCSVLEGEEHQDLVCRNVSQLIGVAEVTAAEETFWAIRRFFEAIARERPLVLVFDDVQWGEPTFLDLVEHIADWSRGSPILVLCAARSELLDLRPGWGGGKLNVATVSLEPLSDAEAGTLIANLLGSTELPAGVGERIVQSAEGNPLFVEQTLAMLIDDGLLARRDARWIAAGDLAAASVPPSIHALLAARLDRLTPDERTVLEAAAVVGKEFFAGAVRDLVPEGARAAVPSHLMALVHKDLVRPARSTLPGQDAFLFRHVLVRDTAYGALPKGRRAELHERSADWLERVAGSAVAEQEEIVGYHLERSAALGARAAARLSAAGRRASGRLDARGAANLLGRALALIPPDDTERTRILYELAEALNPLGDHRGAFEAFDEVAHLAERAGDRSLAWLARIQRSYLQMDIDPHAVSTEDVRAELEEAARWFEKLGDEAGLAMVWTRLSFIEWMPCLYERAERAARRALDHARRSGDQRLVTQALRFLVAAQRWGPATPEEGQRTLDDLVDELSRTRQLEWSTLIARASYRGMKGSLDEARRLMGLALEAVETLGLGYLIADHFDKLGQLEFLAGDAVAAERAYHRSYELFDEQGDEAPKSTVAAMLARTLCALGRIEEAEGYAAIARAAGAEDDLASQALGRSVQALVISARGEHAPAEALAGEAVRMFAGAECPNMQGDLWMDLAAVLRAAGKPEDAARAAREALIRYERKGNLVSSRQVRTFLTQLGQSSG